MGTGPTPWHLGADPHGAALVLAAWAAALGIVVALWYVAGLRRVSRTPRGSAYRWRAVAAASGLATVVVATAPPLGPYLDHRLSTHMAQHLALILVAAPLLAAGAPGVLILVGAPPAVRRLTTRGARTLRRLPLGPLATPQAAWALQVAALWLWHLPGPYDAAVRSGAVHVLEHATFLGAAWLFWWHLLTVSRRRLRGVAATAYLVATVPAGAALGAVLTFASEPLYPAQAALADATGIDPLLDQRIGGLVMWVPLDLVLLALAIAIFGRWLQGVTPDAADADAVPTVPADVRRAEVGGAR